MMSEEMYELDLIRIGAYAQSVFEMPKDFRIKFLPRDIPRAFGRFTKEEEKKIEESIIEKFEDVELSEVKFPGSKETYKIGYFPERKMLFIQWIY